MLITSQVGDIYVMGVHRKYETPEDMQIVIEKYFNSCTAVKCDKNGNPIKDVNGNDVYEYVKPLTVSGLALALGFTSRQTLLNYQGREDFVDIVSRARFKVEEYMESMLFNRDAANGAKFALGNNYMWQERQALDINSTIEMRVRALTDKELEQQIIAAEARISEQAKSAALALNAG